MNKNFKVLLESENLDALDCYFIVRRASMNSALVYAYSANVELTKDKEVLEVMEQLYMYNALFIKDVDVNIQELSSFIKSNKDIIDKIVVEGESILLEYRKDVKQPHYVGKIGSGKEITMRCLVDSLTDKTLNVDNTKSQVKEVVKVDIVVDLNGEISIR